MPLLVLWVLAANPSPAVRAQAALAASCGGCHDRARGDEGGFDFLLDRDALVGAQLVTPGDPRGSKLLQRVEEGEMPPPEALAKLTPLQRRKQRDEVRAALRGWISAGAPAEGFTTAVPDDWRFVPREDIERAVARDLERLPADDRRFTRYFSLLELHNARANDGSQLLALGKALNGLSWRPGLVIPAPVDSSGRVVRVDLRALGWPVDRWESVLLAAYPWAIDSGSYALERAVDATRSRVPVIRADWFLAEATRPPLYHALLGLPSSEGGLEALLHVDAARNIELGKVMRAGFNGSGISQHNRVIERHTSRLGAYWKSYDFSGSAGAQNIFARPLGPSRSHGEGRAFVHSGGEIIFRLPNGLFGFMLSDASGRRLDKAPSAIVRDARRPDGAVENGLSCVSCHARGLIAKADQVRAAVLEESSGFGPKELERVKALYPTAEALAGALAADNGPYFAALKELGIEADKAEPITAAAARYEAELDLRTAAAELAMTPSQLLAAMSRLGARGGALGPLRLAHGQVKRDAFTALFPELVQRLGVGAVVQVRVRSASRRTSCGVEAESIAERIEDCELAFAEGHPQPHQTSLTGGDWSLVLQDDQGRQVWRDNVSAALWTRGGHGTTQQGAMRACTGSALSQIVDASWTLPLARELVAVREKGLPLRFGNAWSQDIDSRHKHNENGVLVDARGARGAGKAETADVVCLAR